MAKLHQMKLKPVPFNKILSGTKMIELRLNDEKRQQVQTEDFICFSLLDNDADKITVRVTDLHHFDNFRKLYAELPKEKIGYSADETSDPDHMNQYYSEEQQAKYGTLGIEFRLTGLQKYIDAQERGYDFGETYQTALSEIRNGEKQTHWIWYVLPQIKGLGGDKLTEQFALSDLEEAADYFEHLCSAQDLPRLAENCSSSTLLTRFQFLQACRRILPPPFLPHTTDFRVLS